MVLATSKNDPMNSEMEWNKGIGWLSLALQKRENNVSLDDEISPEGIMTVS